MNKERNINIFSRLLIVWAAALAVFSASRLVLVLLFWDRVAPTGGLGFIMAQGLRFDLVVLAMLLAPAYLLKPWFHLSTPLSRIGAWLVPVYVASVLGAALFVEASSAPFIEQFDSRPNYLFVEYLEYPREVLSTLAGTHLLELIAFTLAALAVGWGLFRWLRADPAWDVRPRWSFAIWVTPLILVIAFAMIRSTTAHRPVNPSNAAFSQDAMVNHLPLNSPYSVLYAIYERRKETSTARIRYGEMPEEEALKIVLDAAGIGAEDQLDPAIPTLRLQRARFPRERPLNLVIVLEESLGADYVGALGGKDLTPNLDALADEGLWFDRMYATGIRSARGIEAVITGFTPSPSTNVVKRSDTQTGFFTLPSLLQDHGYRTLFVYGGESHFDNMRRFFLNNGFETVIDQGDFENPVFRGAWGVSDEDIFDRTHEELSRLSDQSFFALIFTTSHHEPFDLPPGRVTESEYGPRETSVKYADWALGQFIERARASDYWDDTVFLIIADHNAKTFGGELVPVQRFRIPAVAIGPTIEPRRVKRIASQIDVIPTVLSLMGLSTEHPAIGRDLSWPDRRVGRALMQFHANQAYVEGNRIVVLRPDLPPSSHRMRRTGRLGLDPNPDEELIRRALAHAHWGPLTIRKQAYRRP